MRNPIPKGKGPDPLTKPLIVNDRARRDGVVCRILQSLRGSLYPLRKPRGGIAADGLASSHEVCQVRAKWPPRLAGGGPPSDDEFRRRAVGNRVKVTKGAPAFQNRSNASQAQVRLPEPMNSRNSTKPLAALPNSFIPLVRPSGRGSETSNLKSRDART